MEVLLQNLTANSLIDITALLCLLWLLRRNVLPSAQRNRAYRISIVLTIVVIAAEAAAAILEQPGAVGLRAANIAANAVGFSCSGALSYILAGAYDERLARCRYLPWLPGVVLGVLCAASGWTGWIFSVSAENVYARGPLFFVYTAVFLGGLLLLAAANFRQASRLFLWEKVYLTLLYLLFLAGISVQMMFPQLHTSWRCVTLAMLLYYIFQRELQFKYDQLTGVFNRAAFTQATGRPLRTGTLLIIFDLDDFKGINDRYGHQTGDQCLCLAASVLRECFSHIGRCYRIGGDEFMVLGQADEKAVKAAAAMMILRIRALRSIHPALPNISYGYSFSKEGESFHSAARRADEQMYRFKTRRAKSGPPEYPAR
ncbi:MAG: GGDEF domain-containing protein [Oscillibacter sp.]|jgi:diguanylate cyclase (GGDEF)-like protein|nr:GGDEF domain-containing protein [Oscillibacter sp.]